MVKTNIDQQERGFYFAVSGNDAFTGRTVEVPKKTIQAAVNATGELDPVPGFGDIATVTAAQGGIFNEGFVLAESVQFNGVSTILNASLAVMVELASFANCEIQSVTNLEDGGTCFLIDGKNSSGLSALSCRVLGIGGIGQEIKGTCDNIFAAISQMLVVGADSNGVKVTASSPHSIDLGYNTVLLSGANNVFLDFDPQLNTDTANIDVSTVSNLLTAMTTAPGTVAFVCRKGTLIVKAGSIGASTAFNILGGVAHVSAERIGGDLLVTGGDMFVSTESLTGDITVESGRVLTCDILAHTGSITNNGTINGLINGVPFGTFRQKNKDFLVLNGTDFTTQDPSPAAVDTLRQVTFGPAQFGPTDPVELSAAGAVTCNQTDQYAVSLVFEFGRTGAAGSFALMFFRVLIDGTQFGPSRHAQLDNPNGAFPVQLMESIDFVAGQVLTVEFWRDSTGFNAGTLMAKTPVLAGTNPSPSASIVMKRNRLVQPEIE